MELSILLSTLEDIHDDFSPVWATTALQHAAEISPFVTERTLGSDLQPFADETAENNENELAQNTKNSAVKSKTQKQKNVTTATTPTRIIELELNTSPLSVSSLQNLDLQTIVNSVRLRESEAERQRKVRKGVLEVQEKYNVVLCRRSVEKQQETRVAHDRLLARSQKNEEIIRVKAELQVEQEMNSVSTQLEDMLKKTQRQLQSIFFHSIVQYQRRFRAHYESLIKLLMSHEAKVEHNAKMKQLIQMFDQLINKIKGSECGIAELQVADKLCRALESLEQYVHDEMVQAEGQQQILEQQQQQMLEKQQQQIIEKQQQQQELQQQLKQEEEQQQQLQQQQQQEQQPPQEVELQQQTAAIITEQLHADNAQHTTATASVAQTHVSEERLKFYTHITTFYQEKVERVKPLQADENFKKFRFACQKAINIPVNAISGVNAQHLRDKFEKLYGLLAGQIIKNPDGQFSINEHPLGRDYCLLLMAKKFVSQGDTAISSNPQAAFPVASIIVSLWKSVPDFGKIFLAYIFKESPFMVPYFIAQSPGQTLDEYYKVLGYRSADNKPEPQDMYLKRQAGITRLYAAVMITNSAAQLNVAPHPYGIEHAWRWLVNLIMLDPLPDICATILQEMLQIVGNELWRMYGKQFVKLLLYVQQQYFPRLSAVDEGGPKARLELLLNKYLHEGQIPIPQGVLPANFW